MKVESSSAGDYRVIMGNVEHQIVARLTVICGMSESEVIKHMLHFAQYMAVSRILNPIETGQ